MQFITITGKCGADAEVRNVNGNDVTEIRLAVDQGWGDKRQTNWYRVSVWGKKGANSAPYIQKGSTITVVGELEITEYNGKQQLNVRASDFTLPAKSGDRQQGRQDSRGTTHRNQSGFGSGYPDGLEDSAPF